MSNVQLGQILLSKRKGRKRIDSNNNRVFFLSFGQQDFPNDIRIPRAIRLPFKSP